MSRKYHPYLDGYLIFDKGNNDLPDHLTKWKDDDGKCIRCPFYIKWHSMLRRCYSEVFHKNQVNYQGCVVCENWLTFSNFKSWMETQDWQGKELDKDILGNGKLYSPETCCFVSKELNSFITNIYKGTQGTDFHQKTLKWRGRCNNPLTHKNEHLGLFEEKVCAQQAWKSRKIELLGELVVLTGESVMYENVVRLIERSGDESRIN